MCVSFIFHGIQSLVFNLVGGAWSEELRFDGHEVQVTESVGPSNFRIYPQQIYRRVIYCRTLLVDYQLFFYIHVCLYV